MEDNKNKISIGTEIDKSKTKELFHPPHIENRGKIVYVIDRSGDFSYIDDLKKILDIEKDSGMEIICVQSPEQIPFEERLKQDLSIQEIHAIKKLPNICEKIQTYFPEKKRKGHERPYKYHK